MTPHGSVAAVADIPIPLFACQVGPWFSWFAWHPVRTDDRGWRWLRPCWRRRKQSKLSLPGPVDQWWQTVCANPHREAADD